MVDVLPLTLVGNTLGERHRYLNTLVNNAHHETLPLQSILELPEVCPIDRVFKIKLASKHRHVSFIVENLKIKDMLYVSLALKNMWLLAPEYSYIINPIYLETHLYPQMIKTAVNKMKNFIELNLKNPERCQEFYEYYKSNFDVSIKFLWHCSKEFIAEEVSKIIDNLTPKHLRILCEACPQVAKVYFEGLQNSKVALRGYLKNKQEYFNSILNVLKVDGELFLDLIEKYFDKSSLVPLSSSATRYIMKNFKNRYIAKPELYAGWLLNVKTLTKFLSNEEIKEIIIKLARAQYLSDSFNYKDAEPFIKCLSSEERAAIKKQIFVDKSIGTLIETWPYPAPASLQYTDLFNFYCEPFSDIKHEPCEYVVTGSYVQHQFRRGVMKRKMLSYRTCVGSCMPLKSSLDKLFDRYRFANFDKTFFEFRKLMVMEGTIEGRRNMMLVLISKAGGNMEKLEQLLNFLVERHSNEPVHLRDAVARSLVKRGFVWRLPSEIWDLLLKWTTTSVPEILHSKILRHILADAPLSPADLASYLVDFCDLTTYSLNAAERACIEKRLPALLISAEAPKQLLDTLEAYNIRVNDVPGAEELLVSAARNDEDLLQRLFKSRVARKHLLKETFKILQDDAAYVNALKHDLSVLGNGESFAALVSKEKPKHDRFLHALVLYFSEPDGLAARHRVALEKGIKEEYFQSFARPMAFLFNLDNNSFKNYIEEIAAESLEVSQRKFTTALKANAFVVKPVIDIDTINWDAIGAKFVCNNVLLCSDRDIDANIQKCLNRKKTMRVALRLATRSKSESEVFVTVAKTRPTVALKVALSDIRKDTINHHLWQQVKPIIANLDLRKPTLRYVKNSLGDFYMTSKIEAEYWTIVYSAFYRAYEMEAMPMLCKIENLLTEVDEDSIKQIIIKFLRDKLNKDAIATCESKVLCLYFRIVAKYLLTSQSDHTQTFKRETVCAEFFDKVEILWEDLESRSKLVECLNDFLLALKYSKAFLNTKYVSCIPIFETILERMCKILPRERYFEKYVFIHLTMLYYRSIRQSLKQMPEMFENVPARQNAAVKVVGMMFGKYIAIEIQDLVQSCYKSIIDIYQEGLVRFFHDYFEYNNNRAQLLMPMLQGLIEGGVESQLLAQHVFEKEHSGYVDDEDRAEILQLLKKVDNEEVKFFLNASINPY